MFAIDKPIDEGCPNLKADFSCAIHAQRVEQGFKGCTLFDCHGAGQRVTQDIFKGRTWRDDPAIAAEMFESFRKVLKIHDYLRLVAILEGLPLSDEESEAVALFKAVLAPEKSWDCHTLADFEEMRVITEFEVFAASLKDSPAARALKARFSGNS